MKMEIKLYKKAEILMTMVKKITFNTKKFMIKIEI